MADLKKLQPALATMLAVDKMTMDDAVRAFESLTIDSIKKCKEESACPLLTTIQNADEILYVPAGWLLCASTVQGPLAYGCRKSWAITSESHFASYETLHGLFVQSGAKTTKMQDVLQAISRDQ